MSPLSKEDLRELAAHHHRAGLELTTAVEQSTARPTVKQGLAAKAAWHLTMSTKITEYTNHLNPVEHSATQHHAHAH